MTEAASTPRYGAFPVVALGATLLLEQGERLSLAQAFDGIRDEFHVSDTQLGALAAAMVLVGVVGGIPIGALADRWRRVTLMAAATAIWTVCMGLGAIAPGFALLFVGRLGIGAVEATGPAAFSLLSDYYPISKRARMMGRYQLGSAVGGLFGVGLSGVLVDTFGWRAALWMWILPGIVVVLVVLRLPEPARGAQDRSPTHGPVHDFAGASWGEVLRVLMQIRSMWFGLLSLTISSFLLGALGVWGIEFFKQSFDLSATRAGLFVPAIGGGAALGLVGGGELADRFLHRGVANARVYVTAVVSILASVLLLPAFLTSSLLVATVCLFLGSTCLTMAIAPSEALVSDVVPPELRGRAAAIRSVVRALSALSPLIVGIISDATDLPTALALVTPMYALGGVVMLFAARTYQADLAVVAAGGHRVPSAVSGATTGQDAGQEELITEPVQVEPGGEPL